MIKTDLKNIYLGVINKENGYNVKVYIINDFEKVKTIQLLQGSFQGDNDNFFDLGHSPYKEINIPAKGYFQIDYMDDPGQLDFTTYYNIKVDDEIYIQEINGSSFPKDKLANLPIIKEKGYLLGFNKVKE